jgi:chorismate mutase
MIFQVTQEALDLNYDGMIIETHIDPENAWSDAAQQVTPTQLKDIVSNLIIRKETDETDDYQQNLLKLRLQIDEFDSKLLEVIGKRMKVAESIGALKKEKNVAVLQNKRWNEVLEKMILDGSQKGLSEEFIIQFFKAIHQESIAHQEKVFNS